MVVRGSGRDSILSKCDLLTAFIGVFCNSMLLLKMLSSSSSYDFLLMLRWCIDRGGGDAGIIIFYRKYFGW